MVLKQPSTERKNEARTLAPATAVSGRERVVTLHCVMTGLANLVNEQLGRLTIGPQATRFLRHLERLTFGNAGWHRRAGRNDPGLWCPYDHAAWADALGLSSSALAHLRTRLIEAGIVWYTPDPERRGYGALGWSFDFASWTPRQWGGARSGAGRPCTPLRVTHRAAAAAASPDELSLALPGTEQEPPWTKVHGQAHPPATSVGAGPVAASDAEPAIQGINGGDAGTLPGTFKMSMSGIQDVNQSQSRRQPKPIKTSTKANQDVNDRQIKMSTARPREPALSQAPVARARRGSLKKEEKKWRRRAGASASDMASMSVAVPAAPASSCPRSPTAASPARVEDMPWTQPPSHPDPAPSAARANERLPPPRPYETLRTHWLRIYREGSGANGKEARHLVHAAARALLGMGHEPADDVLLGQLRSASGAWATVLHWILDCAGRELADPRTYLRAIAARQWASPSARMEARELHGSQQRMSAADPRVSPRSDMTAGVSLSALDASEAPAELAERKQRGAGSPVSPRNPPARSSRVVEEHRPLGTVAPDDSDDTSNPRSCAAPASPLPGEPDARAHGVPDGTVDGAAVTPYVPMPHLWHMAQQRLRADLTPAQYSSWMANTELHRAPDGSLVLVTRTTFAAELIAWRWGERIQWVLSEIMSRECTVTAVVPRRRDAAAPDGSE